MAQASKFQVYNLHETYPELGQFFFKVVLSPRYYRDGHEISVSMIDSDRKPMNFEAKTWGRKINVHFDITPNVADGVATATLMRGSTQLGRLTFWVIKP
jgi:hypothetical protein